MFYIPLVVFFSIVLVVVAIANAVHIYLNYANDIKHDKKMKPCPKCGHRAMTVFYNGENNPPFFTAECGAYARRGDDSIGSVSPDGMFKDEPPLTEKQKTCRYCAGYCADVPRFVTRLGAVKWWNKVACSKTERSEPCTESTIRPTSAKTE